MCKVIGGSGTAYGYALRDEHAQADRARLRIPHKGMNQIRLTTDWREIKNKQENRINTKHKQFKSITHKREGQRQDDDTRRFIFLAYLN